MEIRPYPYVGTGLFSDQESTCPSLSRTCPNIPVPLSAMYKSLNRRGPAHLSAAPVSLSGAAPGSDWGLITVQYRSAALHLVLEEDAVRAVQGGVQVPDLQRKRVYECTSAGVQVCRW